MVRRVGVSRCKYRWRYNQHKAPTLASIECCRHIHHLLSDRITARNTAPRSVELCLGESKVGWSKREQSKSKGRRRKCFWWVLSFLQLELVIVEIPRQLYVEIKIIFKSISKVKCSRLYQKWYLALSVSEVVAPPPVQQQWAISPVQEQWAISVQRNVQSHITLSPPQPNHNAQFNFKSKSFSFL